MLPVIIMLAVACLLLAAYLLALFAEVRRMSDKLEELAREGAGGELYTLTCNRHFKRLAACINTLLEVQRRKERQLRRADEAFKESVTGISHDLRTPLTSVSGYLQMVKSERTAPVKKTEYIRIIEGRLATLLALLDELFEYTRVETGAVVLDEEKLNLSAVLMDQLALYYEEFAGAGIEPAVSVGEGMATVFCDRGSLERIFQNLIKNALVHGEGGFAVAVDMAVHTVRVTFYNTAVEEVDTESLFDRFYTADKSRSRKSTGLGLAIVRNLAAAMGGDAGAVWEAGRLHIFVELPLAGKPSG